MNYTDDPTVTDFLRDCLKTGWVTEASHTPFKACVAIGELYYHYTLYCSQLKVRYPAGKKTFSRVISRTYPTVRSNGVKFQGLVRGEQPAAGYKMDELMAARTAPVAAISPSPGKPRSWDELVREGRRVLNVSQWVLGDLASEVVTTYGDYSLARYASDVGMNLNTLRTYRSTARAYPKDLRRPDCPFSVYKVFIALEDRLELIDSRPPWGWDTAAARELVASRKRALSALTPSPSPAPAVISRPVEAVKVEIPYLVFETTICYLCHLPLTHPIENDHVFPRSKGGSNGLVLPTHRECNRAKRDKPWFTS